MQIVISDRLAQIMATKRKSMVDDSAPAPNDENAEQDEDELNMSDDEEGGTRIGDIYIPPPVKPYCSTESIGPRLIITKISNCNFKSYAGEVVLGPFSNVSFAFTTKKKRNHEVANVGLISVFPCDYRPKW